MDIPVEVLSPDGKISLRVRTNQASVVIYTYNYPVEALAAYHGAFSLECQALPNACNLGGFGSILLEKRRGILVPDCLSIYLVRRRALTVLQLGFSCVF